MNTGEIDFLDILDGAIERIDAQLDAKDPNMELIKRDRELKARVFSTPDGKKLMTSWLEDIALGKGVSAESSQIEVGIFEGKRQMVKELMAAIKQVRDNSQ